MNHLDKTFPDDYETSQELFNKICSEKKSDDVNTDNRDDWALSSDPTSQEPDWISKRKYSSSSEDDDDDDSNDTDDDNADNKSVQSNNFCMEVDNKNRK